MGEEIKKGSRESKSESHTFIGAGWVREEVHKEKEEEKSQDLLEEE